MHLLSSFVAQVNSDPAASRGTLMNLIIWLFIGLVAGFLGSKIVNKRGEGTLFDIVLGLIGSVVGGFLFSLVGVTGGGSIIFSIIVATIGAIVVLVIYHALVSPRSAV